MNLDRELKDKLFTEVATLTKAVANPKRLELIELLSQADKTVDQLADEAQISIALTSSHLQSLRSANLVEVKQEGKYRRYSLANAQVADLWVILYRLASQQLPSLDLELSKIPSNPTKISKVEDLIELAKKQEIQLIDVRPENEYEYANLPYSLSFPINLLNEKAQELDKNKAVVTYCRGPFCLYARDAVLWLTEQGFEAYEWQDGVVEYQYQGAN